MNDPYDFDEKDLNLIYKICYFCLVGAVLCIVVAILCGCSTVKYVPVIENHTDTVLITKHQRDSIWQHDSVYIKEYTKGDTFFIDRLKWQTKYIEKVLHDTSYVANHDTIPQPYEVEKKLSRFDRLKIDYGGYGLGLAFLFIMLYLIRLIRRFMP